MQYQYTFDDVKALILSRGGWSSVYNAYPALADAMSSGTHKPCPKSGSGKTKFRRLRDWETSGGAHHNDVGRLLDGVEVLSWYLDKSKYEVLKEIIGIFGGEIPTYTDEQKRNFAAQIQASKQLSPEEVEKRRYAIKKVWSGAKSIIGTAAEVYLRSRGIKGDLSVFGRNLMFNPRLSVWIEDGENSQFKSYAGLLAVIRKNGTGLTLHRTFLAKGGTGKAPIPNPKMQMKAPESVNGGFIELDKPVVADGIKLIGVSEGLETALSVREATGCPMWVGISDRLMEDMVIPKDVTHVIVWADVEASGAGVAAAARLKTRLEFEGKHVEVVAPTKFGREKMDWNDVYVEFGQQGFDFKMPHDLRVYTGVEVEE
jgi:hypothetical protein